MTIVTEIEKVSSGEENLGYHLNELSSGKDR